MCSSVYRTRNNIFGTHNSIYLSFYLSIFLSFFISILLSFYLSIFLSIYPSLYSSLIRVVILTLARTIHIGGLENNGGTWLKEVVGGIMQVTHQHFFLVWFNKNYYHLQFSSGEIIWEPRKSLKEIKYYFIKEKSS